MDNQELKERRKRAYLRVRHGLSDELKAWLREHFIDIETGHGDVARVNYLNGQRDLALQLVRAAEVGKVVDMTGEEPVAS